MFRRKFSSTVGVFSKRLDPVNPRFVDTCPAPSYDTGCTYCEYTLPWGKGIDFDRPLRSSKVALWRHLLVVTETNPENWQSRLENDRGLLISSIAKFKRSLQSPYHPTLVSAVHLPTAPAADTSKLKLLLYPDNKIIEMDRAAVADDSTVQSLVTKFLVPLDQASDDLPPVESDSVFQVSDHPNRLVLACGHTKRDARCGVLAPLITQEFTKVLADRGIADVDVGVISHIGGHAFAGNVIYFNNDGESIWYGRVFPPHVQGIVEETVVKGNVIEDHYRG